MNKKTLSVIKIAILTAFFIIADQFTKYMATVHLKGQNDIIIIRDVLCLHYLDGGNTGAAWGIFSGKIFVFIIFTIVAIIVIGIFISNIQKLIFKSSNNAKIFVLKTLNFAFIMLLAGAIGNLIDRIIHGYVIDFIYFELINFPVFNVADCYVTVACAIIIIICFFKIDETDFNKIFSLKSRKAK